MRQSSGSMICPSCGKLISVGEERCPFCGAWRPGMFGFAPALQRLFGPYGDLTGGIVIACVVLYVISLLLQPRAIFQMHGFLGFLAPGQRALYMLGMTGGLAWQAGWWWTVFTAIYLHGGLLHILFNMLWVRQLGPTVTYAYGPARSFVLFTIAGAVGFLVSNFAVGVPTIGASGSIFGLLGALIVYSRRTGRSMMSAQLWQWAVIIFLLSFFMASVNNWAHAGGFAGGWVTAQFMHPLEHRRESRGVQLLALGFILLTLAGVAMSFVTIARLLFRH